MTKTRQHRLQHFKSEIYGRVEGWLGDGMWQTVDLIGTIFETNGVHGKIAEFDLHHGFFLFLLNILRNDDELCFAIDVFDQQHLNLDHSVQGSLAAFVSHLEIFLGAERCFFKIVQRDTTSFSTSELVGLIGKESVEFFSIDAGHTILHACNGLLLAQEVLVPGGTSALNDSISVHWPLDDRGILPLHAAAEPPPQAVFVTPEQAVPDRRVRTCLDAVAISQRNRSALRRRDSYRPLEGSRNCRLAMPVIRMNSPEIPRSGQLHCLQASV